MPSNSFPKSSTQWKPSGLEVVKGTSHMPPYLQCLPCNWPQNEFEGMPSALFRGFVVQWDFFYFFLIKFKGWTSYELWWWIFLLLAPIYEFFAVTKLKSMTKQHGPRGFIRRQNAPRCLPTRFCLVLVPYPIGQSWKIAGHTAGVNCLLTLLHSWMISHQTDKFASSTRCPVADPSAVGFVHQMSTMGFEGREWAY